MKLLFMKKGGLIGFFLFLICYAGYGQEAWMNGTIRDDQNQPLDGAVIENLGTKVSVQATGGGRFRIRGKNGDIVKITFSGYENQELVFSGGSEQNILMTSRIDNLEEVVVTGALGLKYSAKELGVSVGTVSGSTLNNSKVVNPLQGLQGKVSGLQINMFDAGVNPQVRITLRGARNISDTKNEPLFVVDGVPLPSVSQYNNQLSNNVRGTSAFNAINPNDIESVTVLKGANAAAVYGSQGVNGVIVINTKQGAKGRAKINVSHTSTFDKVAWLPEFQEEFGAGWNGVFQPYEARSWGPKYDGSIVKVGPILPDGTQWELPFTPVKNQKADLFDIGGTHQQSVSLSGADQKSTYYLSAQHANTGGIIPNDRNKKTNLRFNGGRVFGKLSSKYAISYSQNNSNTTTGEPWNNARNMPLYIPISELRDYTNPEKYWAHPEYYFANNSVNPFWAIDNMRQQISQENLNGNISLEYEVTDWFKAIYRLGYTTVHSSVHAYTAKVDNSGTPYRYYDANGNLATATIANGTLAPRLNAAGSVTEGSTTDRQLNSDFLLQFSKKFNRFTSRLLLGQNYQDQKNTVGSMSASAINMPGVYNLSNAVGLLSGSFNSFHQRRYSFFGELMVGYNNYLFLTLNGRQENVSVLSKNNRSYFYPGANLSFVATNAFPGLKSDLLSYAKAYASTSKTANAFVAPYSLQNTYNQVSGFPFGNLNGTVITTTNANPDLKPEFVYSWETGIQLGLLRNRVRLDVTYASADSRDQILEISSSAASGFLSTNTNAARMKSKSFELGIDVDVVNSRDWHWSVGANYTNNNNTVVSIAGDEEMIYQWKGLYIVPGKRYPTYEMPAYETDPLGRVVVNASNGIPVQAANLKEMGTSQPIHLLGANTSLSFKQFTLTAIVDARWGNNYYNAAAENTTGQGLAPITASNDRGEFLFPNSVIKNADGTYTENKDVYSTGNYAFWNAYRNVFSNNVFNGKFIKLRELNITYRFPVSALGHQRVIRGIAFSLIGRNLVNIRAKDNIWGETESIYLSGVGFSGWRTIPSSRTFGFSVNLDL